MTIKYLFKETSKNTRLVSYVDLKFSDSSKTVETVMFSNIIINPRLKSWVNGAVEIILNGFNRLFYLANMKPYVKTDKLERFLAIVQEELKLNFQS